MKPKYRHDCSKCTFIGTFCTFDLYFCSAQLQGTVVARGSSDPSDYASGLFTAEAIPLEKIIRDFEGDGFSGIAALRVAYLIAKDRGLIKK